MDIEYLLKVHFISITIVKLKIMDHTAQMEQVERLAELVEQVEQVEH